MKKIIALFLAAIMLLSVMPLSVLAADSKKTLADGDDGKFPIIYIAGDGNNIYSAAGKAYNGNYNKFVGQIVDVLKKEIVNAVLKGNWDALYAAFEKELGAPFKDYLLDGDGNISNDSGIAKNDYKLNQKNSTTNSLNEDGYCNIRSYNFWYDWRKDPWEVADELDVYVNNVLTATGAKKVSIVGRCMGSDYLMAYLAKYGNENLRCVSLNAPVVGGSDYISDAFSGRVVYNGEAFERAQIEDLNGGDFMDEFIVSAIDLINETDKLNIAGKTFDFIYKKMYKELTPRLVLSTIGTWPGYWASVNKDSYQDAKKLVFGEPGSERYEQYKGLIAKLDRYDEKVRQRLPELLLGAKKSGTNVSIIAKYGYQSMPFIKNSSELGDGLVSINNATLGATTKPIGQTLSNWHITKMKVKGLEGYLSPDNLIDLSTGVVPDTTWIFGGVHHDSWNPIFEQLIWETCSFSGELTFDSLKSLYPSHFMIYDSEIKNVRPMKSDDQTVMWDAEQVSDHGIIAYFTALISFIKNLYNVLVHEIKTKELPIGKTK